MAFYNGRRRGIGQVRPIQPGRGYQFNGTTDTLMRSMAGITISSWEGTATLSIPGSQDRIDATAGTAWDIRLSDGTLYKCDEAGGTLAIDSSGSRNDATISTANLASFHAELNGGADWQNQVGSTPNIRFQRANSQNITIAHDTRFNVTDFNIEFYAVPQNAGGTLGMFFDKRNNLSAEFSPFDVYYNSSSQRFGIVSSHNGISWAVNEFSTNTFIQDTRYHVAYVKNGSVYTLYINGNIEATANVAGTLMTNTSPIFIGGQISGGFNGLVDGFMSQVTFHNSAVRTGAFTPYTTWEEYNQFITDNPPLFAIPNFQTAINPSGFVITNNNTHSHFVPRNENNTALDAYGEPLFYKGIAL